jgi:hypothetical protein
MAGIEWSRRDFLRGSAGLLAGWAGGTGLAQEPGVRPIQDGSVKPLWPRARVPVGIIVDDSTCLVNLNRFAMPQFDAAWRGSKPVYHRDWKYWPVEIPDGFVRKFGEWARAEGVKGKYSVVPYPACVGRLDREMPGWSRAEMEASIRLVREFMAPDWDIHPEMLTHTRVIDLKTGHPFPEIGPKFMENWEWTAGRSADELTAYLAYSLGILKNVGLSCDGVTTPGGFGKNARPEFTRAVFDSVRDVYGSELPHYFQDVVIDDRSTAPKVQLAADLDTDRPRAVVSILGCTGDWTGGWHNVEPDGADRFITPDLKSGRMVDVITKGDPAMMLCHWTGVWWNGLEKGFKVFQEVVRRLKARFDHLHWMKLSELARAAAARELTSITRQGNTVTLRAPYACPDFTLAVSGVAPGPIRFESAGTVRPLAEVAKPLLLRGNTWCGDGERTIVCVDLLKGPGTLTFG